MYGQGDDYDDYEASDGDENYDEDEDENDSSQHQNQNQNQQQQVSHSQQQEKVRRNREESLREENLETSTRQPDFEIEVLASQAGIDAIHASKDVMVVSNDQHVAVLQLNQAGQQKPAVIATWNGRNAQNSWRSPVCVSKHNVVIAAGGAGKKFNSAKGGGGGGGGFGGLNFGGVGGFRRGGAKQGLSIYDFASYVSPGIAPEVLRNKPKRLMPKELENAKPPHQVAVGKIDMDIPDKFDDLVFDCAISASGNVAQDEWDEDGRKVICVGVSTQGPFFCCFGRINTIMEKNKPAKLLCHKDVQHTLTSCCFAATIEPSGVNSLGSSERFAFASTTHFSSGLGGGGKKERPRFLAFDLEGNDGAGDVVELESLEFAASHVFLPSSAPAAREREDCTQIATTTDGSRAFLASISPNPTEAGVVFLFEYEFAMNKASAVAAGTALATNATAGLKKKSLLRILQARKVVVSSSPSSILWSCCFNSKGTNLCVCGANERLFFLQPATGRILGRIISEAGQEEEKSPGSFFAKNQRHLAYRSCGFVNGDYDICVGLQGRGTVRGFYCCTLFDHRRELFLIEQRGKGRIPNLLRSEYAAMRTTASYL